MMAIQASRPALSIGPGLWQSRSVCRVTQTLVFLLQGSLTIRHASAWRRMDWGIESPWPEAKIKTHHDYPFFFRTPIFVSHNKKAAHFSLHVAAGGDHETNAFDKGYRNLERLGKARDACDLPL